MAGSAAGVVLAPNEKVALGVSAGLAEAAGAPKVKGAGEAAVAVAVAGAEVEG